MLPLVIVAAQASNRVIGRANAIPWRLDEDMKHFRALTITHAIIMGRATYESLGKPLPKRRNIVITRDTSLVIPGVDLAHSLPDAIAMARTTDDEPRIIGGGQVYEEAMPLATRIHLTVLDAAHEGDTFFPNVSALEWRIADARRGESRLATYFTLERR